MVTLSISFPTILTGISSFDDLKPCNIFQSHANAILVTSHSKDLGLPGERIGFIAIHPGCRERVNLQNALTLTTRILGFVNAPALMQRILPQLQGAKVSADVYQRLRDVFCEGLLKMGFELTVPQGTFYIFPKSPIPDDVAFVNEACPKISCWFRVPVLADPVTSVLRTAAPKKLSSVPSPILKDWLGNTDFISHGNCHLI